MKYLKIGIVAIVAGVGLFLIVVSTTGNPLEKAIGEYEDRDYKDALIQLNKIQKVQNYETNEKIYYYKCRSMTGLADELNEDYRDELKELGIINKAKSSYNGTLNDIKSDLKELNIKISGDLKLSFKRDYAVIVSGGRYYDEFVSNYPGSKYLEDLDFEELEKVKKANPEHLGRAIIAFYKKHPGTPYTAHLVKLIFQSFNSGKADFSSDEKTLWKIIQAYSAKYQTGAEIHRILTTTGDNINLRNSPGVDGQRLGTIKKGDILIQLEKSMDKSQVGDTRDYWYKISTLKGKTGWLFGIFLKPYEFTSLPQKEDEWIISDAFTEWQDSSTPKKWKHIESASDNLIGFKGKESDRIVFIKTAKNKKDGLYRQFNTAGTFTITSEARLLAGKEILLFAVGLPGNRWYTVKIQEAGVSVSGRTIPLNGKEWHTFTLSSIDGTTASFKIDGQQISQGITPEKGTLPLRGLYFLNSIGNIPTIAEAKYLNVK